MSSKKKVFFKTFGCRTNQFDTQVMMSKMADYSIINDEQDADIVVVNSCTVTNGADSSVRNYISSISRRNSSAKIVMAGCGSHSKGEQMFSQGKVFGVIGHSEKEKIDKYLKESEPFYSIGDLEHTDSTIVSEFIGKSRAFIKIQEGCDFDCSYCIIPSVRGAARSHDEHTILEQISKLSSNGFGEFILTGTNVGSYGKDKGSSIAKLLKKISLLRGVRRIRIGSLEPIQIDAEFLELLDESWMAKHLHIALQHTSDEMLRIMKRRNSFASDAVLLEIIASRGYAIGTDFIVGHPGESDVIWAEAMERVAQLPLTHMHAFTYSQRDGTHSATLKERINGTISKSRHKELTVLIAQKNLEFRKSCSTPLQVLVENGKDEIYRGFDQYYNKITISSKENISSEWVVIDSHIAQPEGNHAIYT